MQRVRCGWMDVGARGKAQPLDESIELGGLHRARSMVAFRAHLDVGAGRSSLERRGMCSLTLWSICEYRVCNHESQRDVHKQP